jgi:nucleoside 2-deoxyribosyltransferase
MAQPPGAANVESGAPRVYLAGPEVFLPDAMLQGEKKKAICRAHNLEGVFPLDTEIAAADTPRKTAMSISQANEGLIRRCVAVIANMTPFRGVSADVGTAYEMGFGRAFGLIVFAYSNDPTPFTRRVSEAPGAYVRRDQDGRLRDGRGLSVEEFDLADNLMLEGGIDGSGGRFVAHAAPAGQEFTDLAAFEECVRLASAVLLRPGPER